MFNIAKGKVVHCKKEKSGIYIGRPSKWGNPYSHKEKTVAKYRVNSLGSSARILSILMER